MISYFHILYNLSFTITLTLREKKEKGEKRVKKPQNQPVMTYTYSTFLQDVQDVSAPLHSKPYAVVHAHCMPLVYSET